MLKWTTEKVRVKDLVPYEKNPRKIEPEKLNKLKELIKEFDVVEIPVINFDGTLITFHQRLKVMRMLGRGDEMIEVRKPNRLLTELEIKKYNIASNSHAGIWDFDVLKLDFADVDLDFFDIELPEISIDETEYAEEEQFESGGSKRNSQGIFVALTDEESERWLEVKEKLGKNIDKNAIFELIKRAKI